MVRQLRTGRPLGAFFDGSAVLDVHANPDQALAALQWAQSAQDAAFRDGMAGINGRPVSEQDAADSPFGLPADPARWARVVTEQNAASKRTWDRFLHASSLQDVADDGPFGEARYLAWRLIQTLKLVTGEWTPESAFLAIDPQFSASPADLIADVTRARTENLWLLAVDFHY